MNVRVKSVDMGDVLQEDAINVAEEVVGSSEVTSESEMAEGIVRRFETLHGACWHCVVGKSFGSFVQYDSRNFIHLQVGELEVLLFRAGI
mmetsp:Transcript_2640/g.7279  ORF Transcript_2640/g.7279 Transcript_2640/m.7279 type:complete len:90 (+) Transcript_2640:141-410(+)